MKKIVIILAAMCCVMGVKAQVVNEGDASLVYYMPKNALQVKIHYKATTYKAGPYKDFAKELLGIDDVIQRNESDYELTKATVRTITSPDFSRPVVVTAKANIPLQLLALTKDGLLAGYNVSSNELHPAFPTQQEPQGPQGNHRSFDRVKAKTSIPEEVTRAVTKREKAELLAKQIYRLRETRIYLLSGEVDKMPTDGEATKEVLRQLEAEEKGLTELFTGTKSIRHLSETFVYEPTQSERYVLCRFSEADGLIDKEDEVGEPVVLNAQVMRQIAGEAQDETKDKGQKTKDKVMLSPIMYNLPGWLDYTIEYGVQCLASKSLPIAQFGIAVPLAQNLFTGKVLPQIVFNTQTGNIKNIHQ